MFDFAAPAPPEDDPAPKFFAVGIAASAGGVRALTTLASALSADLPATLLLAYHQGVAHPAQLRANVTNGETDPPASEPHAPFPVLDGLGTAST